MRRRNSDTTTICLFVFYGDNAIEASLSSDPTEHFTPDEFELLYLRQDLYDDEDRAREAKARFVENERLGFDSRETYNSLAAEPGSEPDIGEYESTVQVFSEGFVSRVLVGGEGIILTTDSIDMRDFETVAVALRVLLAESSH